MFIIIEDSKNRRSFLGVNYYSGDYPYWSACIGSVKYFSTYEQAETFIKNNAALIENYILSGEDKIKICEIDISPVADVKIMKGEFKITKRTLDHIEYYPD